MARTLSSAKLLNLTCMICMILLIAARADAQLLTDLPDAAKGIRVEDKVGEYLPLDLLFTDEAGNKVSLGKFFNKGKPIILTLNYSDCPGLCIAQLDNLVENFRGPLGQQIGDQFEIVTVSIDPTELPSKAASTKSRYVGMLRDTKAEASWHFLTGDGPSIRKLAQTVGFVYTYDKVNKRYNHAAVTYFISPKGRVCRYLLQLGVEPEQLKLAIGEANAGVLTTSLTDAIIQMCYMYDPDANRYVASARSVMAFGGAAFTMMIFGLTAPFWFSKRGAAKTPLATNSTANELPTGYINSGSDASPAGQSIDQDPSTDKHE
jgi:protein SCO1